MRPVPQPGLSAPIAASSSPYGPELWPQPAFASSTGLTLSHATVAAGLLTFAGLGVPPQRARATLGAGTITAGTYHWELTIVARGAQEPLGLAIGGSNGSISSGLSTGLFTGQITTSATTQNIDIADGSGGDLTATFSTFSVKRVLP